MLCVPRPPPQREEPGGPPTCCLDVGGQAIWGSAHGDTSIQGLRLWRSGWLLWSALDLPAAFAAHGTPGGITPMNSLFPCCPVASLLLCMPLTAAPVTDPPGRLQINVDDSKGQPLPCRLHLTGPDGKPV